MDNVIQLKAFKTDPLFSKTTESIFNNLWEVIYGRAMFTVDEKEAEAYHNRYPNALGLEEALVIGLNSMHIIAGGVVKMLGIHMSQTLAFDFNIHEYADDGLTLGLVFNEAGLDKGLDMSLSVTVVKTPGAVSLPVVSDAVFKTPRVIAKPLNIETILKELIVEFTWCAKMNGRCWRVNSDGGYTTLSFATIDSSTPAYSVLRSHVLIINDKHIEL